MWNLEHIMLFHIFGLRFVINLLNIDRFSTMCQHGLIDHTGVVTNVMSSDVQRLIRRSLQTQLRIHTHYDRSIKSLKNFLHIKRDIIEVAANFWEEALLLRRLHTTPSRLTLDRVCVNGATKLMTFNNQLLTFCTDGCMEWTKCGPINIPVSHLNQCRFIYNGTSMISGHKGEGIYHANFILYISSLRTHRCNTANVLGYAAHCQLEANTDRPVAGYINFCPDTLSHQYNDKMRSLFVATHEILHSLGFSSSLFAFYRDKQNRPLTPRDPTTFKPALGWYSGNNSHVYQWSDNVVRTVNRTWLSAFGTFQKLAHIVVLPTVVRIARLFYNCPTLDGVELEDEDGAGVYLTHWEKRILENDLMTATYTNSFRISPITLAMMEDTGWYIPNYALSQSFSWGKGRGCTFATGSCLEYMLEQNRRDHPITPFCQQLTLGFNDNNNRLQVSCTPDGESYGFCNLIEYYKPLPSEYVYFVRTNFEMNASNSEITLGTGNLTNQYPLVKMGGKIALANYCPYHQEIEWEDNIGQSIFNTHCHASTNLRDPHSNFKLERFGANSVCVEHSSKWHLISGDSLFIPPLEGAGCYTFRCSLAEGGLVLELAGGISFPCEVPGELHQINACLTKESLTVQGKLICPDCRILCPSSECPEIHPISQSNITYIGLNHSTAYSSLSFYETEMFIPTSKAIHYLYSQLNTNETKYVVENPLYIVEDSKMKKGITIQQAILPGTCSVNMAYSSVSLSFLTSLLFVISFQYLFL
ncbi:Leishmanolysin-like peptidase [Schistosoma japonicum]|nr:Leishmanolysin-like peptidase [Schistosoma japonicum]